MYGVTYIGDMSGISKTIDAITDFHAKVGTAELSRLSGVPYTSVIDLAAKGFRPRYIHNLERLAEAVPASPSAPAPA